MAADIALDAKEEDIIKVVPVSAEKKPRVKQIEEGEEIPASAEEEFTDNKGEDE